MAIENLTAKKPSELTPEQKRNKKLAKQGNYRDVNLDRIPDRDQVDLSALDADLKWASDLVTAVPELQEILIKHTEMGSFDKEAGAQGLANFKSDVLDSLWWKENNQYARKAFALQKTDPSAYGVEIEDAVNEVRETVRTIGIDVSEADISAIATEAVNDGWLVDGREYKLRERLSQYVEQSQSQGKAKGNLRSYASSFRNTATANGLQLSSKYFEDLAKSVTLGLMSEDDAEAEIREQAAGFWPSYSDKILAGYNVRDLASGYIYTMANELELDPQSISLDDSYIRSALTSVDDTGNARPKSLWEFQRELRNDPRWMNTNKAQNQVSSIASRVMEMFGL
jgi:hypothetical protein